MTPPDAPPASEPPPHAAEPTVVRRLGVIGLGRMGANLIRRLHHEGMDCVAHDRDPEAVAALVEEGVAAPADTVASLINALEAPRAVWIMVPATAVDDVIDGLEPLLEPGDLVVDGGNTHFALDQQRAVRLGERGIDYVDVGTSGGVWGLERGYCLMVGGEDAPVARLAPVFDALAPGVDAVARTVGRSGPPAPAEAGWLHCGPAGAGHFVKMVHNGIEYAMMAAYAEGFDLLARAGIGDDSGAARQELAPGVDAARYAYHFDLEAVAEVWRRGSVIGSWLLDLTAMALATDPELDRYAGRVGDSGEGRWVLQAGVDTGTPVPTMAGALFERFASRGNAAVARKVLSAMRAGFGGHFEPPAST